MAKPPLHRCRGGFGWNCSVHLDKPLKALNDHEKLHQHLFAVSFQLAVGNIPHCEAESLDQSTVKTFFRLQDLPLLLIIACLSKPIHFFLPYIHLLWHDEKVASTYDSRCQYAPTQYIIANSC